MLSLLIPIRNAREMAHSALHSTAGAVRTLGLESDCEFIIVDDASEPSAGIPALVADFRRSGLAAPVQGFRFKQRHHYTHAMALGMSVARGDQVLMVSHDMIATPAYVRTLLAVAGLHGDAGVIRGTSAHIDLFPHHVVHPPIRFQTGEDVTAFSEFVAGRFGMTAEVDPFLIGDSFLVTRRAIDKVGVFDTRFVGFLGDIDFGLRVRRAGFKLLCAKGAWLHHEGSGLTKVETAAGRGDVNSIHAMHQKMVNEAFILFRDKWDASLPLGVDLRHIPYDRLCTVRSPTSGEFARPMAIDPAEIEVM